MQIFTPDSSWQNSPFDGIQYKRVRSGGDKVVVLTKVEADSDIPPHRHFSHEILRLESGSFRTLSNSYLSPGQELHIPAGERHGGTAVTECVFRNEYLESAAWVLDNGDTYLIDDSGDFAGIGTLDSPGVYNLPI